MPMQRTQFIVVRHGETEWNIRGIRQGNLDSRLTEKGMAQAKALAQRLAREKFSALYSSDLGRAVHTAKEIAALTGHEIITDARLRERHLGIFQGLNGDEIVAKYPEERRQFRTMGPDYVIPGGESMRQVQRRIVETLMELNERHPNQTVVAVSHGDVIRAGLVFALGMPLDFYGRLEVAQGSLSTIRIDSSGIRVLTVNDRPRLP